MGDIDVLSVKSGEKVNLPDIWSEKRVVLCFLRHLGCRFCHQQIAALNEMLPELKRIEISVVAISMAPSLQAAREFLQKTQFKGEFYIDVTSEMNANIASKETFDRQAKSYRSLRLKRGVSFVRDNEKVKQKGKEALKAGFKDWKPPSLSSDEVHIWPGDIFQVGGVFVVGPGNFCDYAYRSAFAGDHPPSADVIRAATGLESNGKEFVYPVTEQWLQRLGSLTPVLINKKTPRMGVHYVILMLIPLVLALFTLDPNKFTTQGFDHQMLGFAGLVATLAIVSTVPGTVVKTKTTTTTEIDEKTTPENVAVKDPLPKPALMTPKEIDRKLLEQGMIECDCGAVVNELPFMDVMSSESESKDTESKTTRVRSQTWDSSLGPNEYQTILCYVKNFLAKAHPAVGRSGPVCPFVCSVLEVMYTQELKNSQ